MYILLTIIALVVIVGLIEEYAPKTEPPKKRPKVPYHKQEGAVRPPFMSKRYWDKLRKE